MPAPDLAPLLAWGRSHGLAGEPTEEHRRPWSLVVRVGDVWLKACSRGTAHEAPLLDALRRWGSDHVVLPLAADVERGYLALPDSGRQVRGLDDNLARWPSLLAEHAAFQRSLVERADELVALGVPDRRPALLPGLLDELVARLEPPADLRRELGAHRPCFEADCALLATGPVPASLQHDDLHDGNVLVDGDGAARLIDWGDASVTHPFGVLLVTIRAMQHRHGLSDEEADRLRDAYLEPWSDLADRPALRRLAEAAQRVQPLGRSLAWERALLDADAAERAEEDDPGTGWLEELVGRS